MCKKTQKLESIPQLEQRIVDCNTEILSLAENNDMDKWLIVFKIKYWEKQIQIAEAKIHSLQQLHEVIEGRDIYS